MTTVVRIQYSEIKLHAATNFEKKKHCLNYSMRALNCQTLSGAAIVHKQQQTEIE